MHQTKLLKSVLELFEEYFKSGANEIAIQKEKQLFLDMNGEWIEKHDERLTYLALETFCVQLANSRETQFGVKNPSLSTSIPGTNYRVQAMHHSVLANQRVQINIRIPSTKIFSIEDFYLDPTLGYSYQDMLEWVKQRKNILISGGTGTGKTSLLNTLLQEIDHKERIVTIQDSPELTIPHPNKTEILVSKNDDANFSYIDGVNASMRLSPGRLILGELDTRNTLPFLRLNNTGHSGSISTIHANSPLLAIKAITINATFHYQVNDQVLHDYIHGGLDYIVQISYDRAKKQRIISAVEDLKKSLLAKSA